MLCCLALLFVGLCLLITSFLLLSITYVVIFIAEYERSLEESGEEREADVEKGSWEVEDSPEKMCGM